VLNLANSFLQFDFDLNTGYWSLRSAVADTPYLESARMGAIYELAGSGPGRTVYWDGELYDSSLKGEAHIQTAHGPARLAVVEARTSTEPGQALAVRLEFALPVGQPFLLWRLGVTNPGEQAITLRLLDLVRVGPRFQPRSGRSGVWFRLRSFITGEAAEDPHPAGPAGRLRLAPHGEETARLAFFSNGYQSWSFAGALQADARQPSSMFGPLLEPKLLNLVTPRMRRPGRFTSDMFGVIGDREQAVGIVAGFLAQREQFSSVEVLLDPQRPSLRLTAQCDDVCLRPGESRSTDWAYVQFTSLNDHDPLADYTDAVAREHDVRLRERAPVGWCSWYQYFTKVTEADVLSNLEALQRQHEDLPLDFLQLDDGFQAQVGDWFETNATFPHGLKWLAEEIRARQHTPGLWLAPYMVRSDARIRREHPDWLLRDADGRLVNAGLNWSRWCYALDPTHPGVRDHIRRLISTAVNEWGFPYLKLDFLYAAALPARRYDASLTRAQAMHMALSDIRAAAGPDTFLLGCGCPLGPAIGLVDGMRISTDVAPDWNPRLLTPHLAPLLQRELDFLCVRHAIRNTINRAPLHRRWWLNDPDCLLVRDHDTSLTEDEVCSLASVIGLSGGMFLVSDDMTRLKPERRRYVASLLPVLGESARARGWMDSEMPDLLILPLHGAAGDWLVAGVFNWDDVPASRSLAVSELGLDPCAAYTASEFWSDAQWHLSPGEALELRDIPAHGARLLALRRFCPGCPHLVSSSLHFSQGAEISRWRVDDSSLCFEIDLGRQAEGLVRLHLPAAPRSACVDGRAIEASQSDCGVYALPVRVCGKSHVHVNW
jgi:alpha-galactosidase